MPSLQKRVLVVFESQHGQSRKIAEYVAELARLVGHSGRAIHVSLAPRLALGSYDAVVVVAPVHYARHPRTVRRFLHEHARLFRDALVAFVSVSNRAASSDPAVRAEATELARRFIEAAGVRPAVIATIGGGLAYPSYNPLVRWVMRRIAASTGAPTDTSYAHELTSWSDVGAMLLPFLHALPRPDVELAAPPPESGIVVPIMHAMDGPPAPPLPPPDLEARQLERG